MSDRPNSALQTIIITIVEKILDNTSLDAASILKEEMNNRLVSAVQAGEEFGLTNYQTRELIHNVPYFQETETSHPKFQVRDIIAWIDSHKYQPRAKRCQS